MQIFRPLQLLAISGGLSVLLSIGARQPPGVRASAIVVDTLAYTQVSDGHCSLREALLAVNNNAAVNECVAGSTVGEDRISFAVSGTISLSSTAYPTDAAGLVIDGSGQKILLTAGTAVVFRVLPGAQLTLVNLTIANNTVGGWGAGISNQGTLTIANSTFRDNAATSGAGGAAVYNDTGGTLTIYNSTFTQNTAIQGCAIYASAGSTANVTNSTVAGNNCFLPSGGALKNQGMVTLRNTIVADNGPGAANCVGTVTNGGNNLDSGSSCGFGSASGSLSNANALLGALGDYGGPTQTLPLLAGSPAINAGNATICAASAASPIYGAGGIDQRGYLRTGGSCDIGAFELLYWLYLPVLRR